jgi:hypothetical protein
MFHVSLRISLRFELRLSFQCVQLGRNTVDDTKQSLMRVCNSTNVSSCIILESLNLLPHPSSNPGISWRI